MHMYFNFFLEAQAKGEPDMLQDRAMKPEVSPLKKRQELRCHTDQYTSSAKHRLNKTQE